MIRRRFESLVDRTLRLWGRQLCRVHGFDPLSLVLEQAYRPGFTFVQIGANDGVAYDPIHAFVRSRPCRGVAVEPVSEYFEQLRATYRSRPEVELVQCAIGATPGRAMIYRVRSDRPDLPRFARGVASLDPRHHERTGIPSDAIVAEEVEVITLAELLDRCRITEIDLLQIDAEGSDFEILISLDFERVKPRVINFEHGLPDGVMNRSQFHALIDRFVDYGYRITISDYDCLAHR